MSLQDGLKAKQRKRTPLAKDEPLDLGRPVSFFKFVAVAYLGIGILRQSGRGFDMLSIYGAIGLYLAYLFARTQPWWPFQKNRAAVQTSSPKRQPQSIHGNPRQTTPPLPDFRELQWPSPTHSTDDRTYHTRNKESSYQVTHANDSIVSAADARLLSAHGSTGAVPRRNRAENRQRVTHRMKRASV